MPRYFIFVITIAVVVWTIGLNGCQIAATVPETENRKPPVAAEQQTTVQSQGPAAVLWVKGLACPFCTYNVEKQLLAVAGVESVDVELATGKVTVNLSNKAAPSEAQLRAAIKQSGFTVDRIEMP